MLYQMLTEHDPFLGEDYSALHKVMNEPFPPLQTYLHNYPPALNVIVERALAKNPEDRYVAEEMAAALAGLRGDLERAEAQASLAKVKWIVQQEQWALAGHSPGPSLYDHI
jgi:eukaryotic-like serine/threonine-protein kinase